MYQKSSAFQRQLLPRTEKQLNRYVNPDNDPRGVWSSDNYVSNKSRFERPTLWYPVIHPKTGEEVWPDENAVWRYSKDKHKIMVKENRLYWGPDISYKKPRLKRFLSEIQDGVVPSTWWPFEDVGHNDEGQKETGELLGKKIFSTPKPVRLIKKTLTISTAKEDDIILDFFAGSGTTAQAVLELNKEDGGSRKFILVQMPEQCDEDSEAYKAGYKTIADIAKERIRRVIQKIEKEKAEKPDLFAKGNLDLGFKVFKLSPSSFKIWRSQEITEENLEQQLDAFTNPTRPGAEKQNMLYELMLKAGYEITSPVQYVTQNHPSPQSSPAEGRGGLKVQSSSAEGRGSLKVPSTLAGEGQGGGYYSINNNELIIALDAVNEKLIEQIIAAKPQKVITLDSLFTGNDQLKTNTVLQMRDAGVDFKTI
ncbi:MAG: site-specific DNA-methyltransferase [Deltaproteobacteria bacterium]|nr:site-specific DNA-methyltransferase [Deltaproteobacteria bacterium]